MRAPVLLVVATAALASACAVLAPAPRAIWTWESESYAMVEDPAVAGDAIAFLKRQRIGTIYLYTDAYGSRNLIEERPALYRDFIRRLHGQGMRVYALLGSAYLHTEEYVRPGKRAEAMAMFHRVLTYNAAAAPDARLDGISIDIEPHMLPQWSDHRAELLRGFLDLGRALMALKRESGQEQLPLGAAIPFWLDGIPLEWRGTLRPASEHALDTFDYVALMDYRDHADGHDGIIAHAASEMAYAAGHGRKVVIGVEVTANEVDKVTFAEEDEPQLERELRKVEEAYGDNPAFAGFAIHHYRSYRSWLEEQRR